MVGLLNHEGATFEHRLLASDDQFLQSGLSRRGLEIGLGGDLETEVVERLGIDGIGLGLAAQASGKVSDLTRVGDSEGEAGGVSGRDQGAMIGAGGLTDQVSAWSELGQKPAMMCWCIGQGAAGIGSTKIELFLGKIDAEVDGRCRHEVGLEFVTMTHPCAFELTAGGVKAATGAPATVRVDRQKAQQDLASSELTARGFQDLHDLLPRRGRWDGRLTCRTG